MERGLDFLQGTLCNVPLPPMPRATTLCLIYFTLGLSRAHSQRHLPKNGTELPGVHMVSLFLQVKTESVNLLRSSLV